ncbi:MAG TPA: hypothetical protein VFA09_02610 [Ktedonobacteraceae bacterium]|nr:hypothetical protein [Ktedonobacteraceae bacterium]
MGLALNKRQLLVIVLVFLSLLVAAIIVVHGAFPSLWQPILHAKPQIINRYG